MSLFSPSVGTLVFLLLSPWQPLSSTRGLCQLHYLRLPKDIGEDHVILMDSTVSTGAAAMMAVRVLLVGGGEPPRSASQTS